MIIDPFHLLAGFLLLLGVLFWLETLPGLRMLFHYVPPVLWILVLPMAATTAGITPPESALYDWLRNYVLVAALVLLLLSANVRAIFRLGRPALLAMLTASFGIAAGTVVGFWLLHASLPDDGWKAMGPLLGVWIGGYGNMLAVAASIDAQGAMLTNAILVDTVAGFGWMMLLIWIAPLQVTLDRWLGADRTVLEELNQRLAALQAANARPLRLPDLAAMLALAFGLGCLALQAGSMLPTWNRVVTPFTWSVILTTAIGIILSFTPVSRLRYAGATPVGTFLLYLAYAAVGAQSDLRGLGGAPWFLLVGAVALILHGGLLLAVGRWLRVPVFLLATASQANIGGMATAPVVATVYQSSLAGVAVLMVPLGLAYGTFLALAASALCRFLAS